ncbi:MAG: TatD family hydrolase [Epsilonproteobacteria bacterium]|nr:TatD family hydrolase [Campylobacterota bacterium]
MFVDTHCHLNIVVKKEFDQPLQPQHFPLLKDIIAQASEAGVKKIINVGTSLVESQNCVAIAREFDSVFATVGIHPCDCGSGWLHDFKKIEDLVKHKKENNIVAIGETGLDFYHKPFFTQRQVDAFKAHIELAIEHDLPLVIHVRDSGEKVLEVLEPYASKKMVRGVIHCFMQDEAFAKVVCDWGLYVGIDGPINYPKNEQLREVVKSIDLDHIILETDAPFLPPQQFRGKQNRPAYIPLIAQSLADVKQIDVADVERITTRNALTLFMV